MHNPQRMPLDCALRAAMHADFDFAEALTRANMEVYYKRHGLIWHSHLFFASWNESENFIIETRQGAIGVLRLTEENRALHVRDIQIAAAHRGCGAGTFVLRAVRGWARQRGLTALTLRVFFDNPAVLLYERLGYRLVSSAGEEIAAIRCMKCVLE